MIGGHEMRRAMRTSSDIEAMMVTRMMPIALLMTVSTMTMLMTTRAPLTTCITKLKRQDNRKMHHQIHKLGNGLNKGSDHFLWVIRSMAPWDVWITAYFRLCFG
jgi:hypothetical protein